ncbi:hypothetical protein BROUX41_005874 [Berkeleyomyces rouxiae]|uniref:uncharacterized protein n=1 Tax=Berkeleyomyces rouxiae TaxID=2035830 RepID=UPI003B827331
MAHHESSSSPLLALISHPPFHAHTHSLSNSHSHSHSRPRSLSPAPAPAPVPMSSRSVSGSHSTGSQNFSMSPSASTSTSTTPSPPYRSVSASFSPLHQHRHPHHQNGPLFPLYPNSNSSHNPPSPSLPHQRPLHARSPLRHQQSTAPGAAYSLDITKSAAAHSSAARVAHTRHLSLHENYSRHSHGSSPGPLLPQSNSGYSYGLPSVSTLSSRKMGVHSHSHSQLIETTPITIEDFSSSCTSGQLSLSTSTSTLNTMNTSDHKHRGHGSEKISGDLVGDHHHDHDHGHAHTHDHSHSCSSDHKHSHGHGHDHHSHGHDHHHDHDHEHDQKHFHAHKHSSTEEKSRFTKFLMRYTSSYPFLNAIMIEKDSRRILYYMLLNVSFMMVQAFYGYVTDSLGLLSDTVHMFFDCMALLVGLVASVLGKRPPSQRFPYGLGKIETLSGFANGILLVLLSVEITFEAFERIWEGSETKRLGELLAVSVMGMVVNLVGMAAFGHHHHGHGGHDHGHEGHSHGGGGCGGHDNENMQGIYLHVLADTLGSASVVVSTLLTYFTGHSFWDQLASVFISVLILGSSKPLIMSAARRLLLGIPDGIEYNLRNTLSGIAQQRGVLAYSVPKFWMDDRLGRENRLLGIVHVVAAKGASLEDVRDRVQEYLAQHKMDIIVQVEREGDASCWCDIGRATSGLALASASSM